MEPLKDGDLDLIEVRSTDTTALHKAMEALGSREPEQQEDFGAHLAVEILANELSAEQAHWAGRYAAERHLAAEPVEQGAAYERNDPKHPEYPGTL
ncbi:hypothetical protein [Arthrobacter sp. Br18]|uniref:hypothetical protein n=1 Tax=Arthrobacter sp. Br18 TaxID=1312954 RepID=UPI00047BD790|nr:hypothetical protein [Arthrobacter sp. Br18]